MRFTLASLALAFCAFGAPSVDPPKLRLPDAARPTRYAVDLTIVPDKDTFRGAVDINLDVKTATSVL